MRRLRYLAGETAMRAAACFCEYVFVHASVVAWLQDRSRISLFLMAVQGAITIVALMLSREAVVRDWHPAAMAALPVVYGYPLLIDVHQGLRLASEPVAVGVQTIAILWLIYAKLSLGRSFGLLPANRGIVVRGAYRYIRHPIYIGYILSHAGFLLASFSWRNFAVYFALHTVQVVRLLREEKLLLREDDYRRYRTRVRFRLIPGVF
jgi:protein-S-isoprenylcysteine O-methyltransferase Ste14